MIGSSLALLVLCLLFAALGGAALVARVLREHADRAAAADATLLGALPVGLLVAAFPGWILSGFTETPIRVCILLAIPVLAGLLGGFLKDLLDTLPRTARGYAPLIVLFATFLLFLWLRSPIPEIRQTEKFMDHAILNALIVQETLPLGDPWFAGERLPYYHFGTYVLALPVRASGFPAHYAYNVLVALVAAMAAGAAFLAVRLRGGGRGVAVMAVLFVTVWGTLDGARQKLGGTPLSELDVWVSSRRVKDTITEWPFFTLRLGDLHPHCVAIPFFLLVVGFAGVMPTTAGLVLDALLFGSLVSANPWDLPGALLALAVGNLALRPFLPSLLRSLATVVVAFPFLFTALASPRPAFTGLRASAAFTESWEAFLHWGTLLIVPVLAVGVALARSRKKEDEAFFAATAFPALGIALSIVSGRPVLGLGLAFLVAVLYLASSRFFPGTGLSESVPGGALLAGFLLTGAGTVLVMLPEVFVVKDNYGEDLHRMNTVFKCYASGWLFLAPGAALLLPLALATRRARKTVRVLLALFFLGALASPAGAILKSWKEGGNRGVDGLAFMAREFPGDRAAVAWLQKNAPPGAVVAEVPGVGYEDRARIGTFSGRPTVLGWANHQLVWRGSAATPAIDARRNDLRTLYTTTLEPALMDVVVRYGIRYVIVGPLEREGPSEKRSAQDQAYGENAFALRGKFKPVFEEQGTAIYEMPIFERSGTSPAHAPPKVQGVQ